VSGVATTATESSSLLPLVVDDDYDLGREIGDRLGGVAKEIEPIPTKRRKQQTRSQNQVKWYIVREIDNYDPLAIASVDIGSITLDASVDLMGESYELSGVSYRHTEGNQREALAFEFTSSAATNKFVSTITSNDALLPLESICFLLQKVRSPPKCSFY